jgi:hypothetical protein
MPPANRGVAASKGRIVMKRLLLGMGVLGLLAAGGPVLAEVCDMDPRPASTLLLPYFEVDTNDAKGANPEFSIGNATLFATMTHVTVWSDLSVPVLGFDVYLTGYDMAATSAGTPTTAASRSPPASPCATTMAAT